MVIGVEEDAHASGYDGRQMGVGPWARGRPGQSHISYLGAEKVVAGLSVSGDGSQRQESLGNPRQLQSLHAPCHESSTTTLVCFSTSLCEP